MKTSSCKAKGRGQQQLVRDLVLEFFPSLKPEDVVSTPMGVTGMDLMLSSAAREKFPFAVESRKREKINVWECIRDAEKHAAKEGLKAMGVIGRNHQRPYALISLDLLMPILLDAYRYRYPHSKEATEE
jgi:hypothetical protein